MNMISFVRKAQIYSGIDIKQLGSQLFGYFTSQMGGCQRFNSLRLKDVLYHNILITK